MEIIFLGTGEAHGMPVGLCDCNLCNEYRKNGKFRSRPSIIIKEGDTNLLFDISPDFRNQIITNKISKIDATFVTHAHFDHLDGIGDLYLSKKTNKGPVYLSKETHEYVMRFFPWIKEEFVILKDFEERKIADLSITPFPLEHAKGFETKGFIIKNKNKKVIYAPDFSKIDEKSMKIIGNANVSILDGQYVLGRYLPDPLHIDGQELKLIAQKARLKQIYLIGISEHYMQKETKEIEKQIPEGLFIPSDNQKISL
ncbi:MAG: MBL fold metallo-hydrolase [archaeon]